MDYPNQLFESMEQNSTRLLEDYTKDVAKRPFKYLILPIIAGVIVSLFLTNYASYSVTKDIVNKYGIKKTQEFKVGEMKLRSKHSIDDFIYKIAFDIGDQIAFNKCKKN